MPAVPVGALELAYHERGSGDPLVLINGTGESGLTWLPLMERLGARFRCVAYDQRDTGGSSYVGQPYTPADLAADAAGVIDALSLGTCHVIGYSLGGAVTQELAIARPDLVRSLVLLSTWAGSDGWFRAQMRSWQSLRRAHPDDDHAFLAALAVWMWSPVTFAIPGEVRRLGELPDRLGETPQRAEGWFRQCEADKAHDAAGRLGGVRAPALVIVGDDDICTPPRYARELVELLGDAMLVTIPHAGHGALFEQPEAVARAIVSFLGRL